MELSNPQRIRGLISDTLVSLGAPGSAVVQESLLIRAGTYCGHRFRKGDYQAVWFVEEDQVKFFGPGKHLVKSMRPSQVAAARAA